MDGKRGGGRRGASLSRFRDQLYVLFRDALGSGSGSAEWQPAVDVIDRADSISIRLDLPGLDEADLRTEVEGDVVTVRGERADETDQQDSHRHVAERHRRSFTRWFQLPEDLDPASVRTSYDHGLLVIDVRKVEARGSSRSR